MDFGSVLGFFGNAASGGLIGAVGGLLSKGVEMWMNTKLVAIQLETDKAKYDHEQKMQALANSTLEMEINANLKK